MGTEIHLFYNWSNSIGNFSKLSRNVKIRFKKNFSPLPERTFDTTSAMGPKAYYMYCPILLLDISPDYGTYLGDTIKEGGTATWSIKNTFYFH